MKKPRMKCIGPDGKEDPKGRYSSWIIDPPQDHGEGRKDDDDEPDDAVVYPMNGANGHDPEAA